MYFFKFNYFIYFVYLLIFLCTFFTLVKLIRNMIFLQYNAIEYEFSDHQIDFFKLKGNSGPDPSPNFKF